MTKISGNFDKFYEGTFNNLRNAQNNFNNIRNINNNISYQNNFEERYRLQGFINDFYNLYNDLNNLIEWVNSCYRNYNRNIDNNSSKASSLPYREVSNRKGLL